MIFNRGRHGVQFFVDRFSLFHPRRSACSSPLPRVAREIREKFTLAAATDRINELDSLPPSIDSPFFFFFFPFFTSFQRFLSHLPGPRPLVEYLRRQAFAINSRWLVEAVSRADKRTFAADESRQILAPWNTIDRLQPLRLIAFEP